jgi:hypothetical protein
MAAKKKRPSRRHPIAPSKPERIRVIELLMAGQRWQDGETTRELAARWGLHPNTVGLDAAEASRNIHRAVQQDETLRSVVVTQLKSLGVEARIDGDRKHALEALRILVGVTDPKDTVRVQVQVERGLSELLDVAKNTLAADQYTRLLVAVTGITDTAAALPKPSNHEGDPADSGQSGPG